VGNWTVNFKHICVEGYRILEKSGQTNIFVLHFTLRGELSSSSSLSLPEEMKQTSDVEFLRKGRMASSGMLRRVALVRTDVS
jgi:hypothetical protein